jgi:hypothetical protein
VQIVAEEGGFEVVLCDKKWTRVAARLGFAASSKSIGSMLKTHYEKLLYPYDIFRSGVMLGSSVSVYIIVIIILNTNFKQTKVRYFFIIIELFIGSGEKYSRSNVNDKGRS